MAGIDNATFNFFMAQKLAQLMAAAGHPTEGLNLSSPSGMSSPFNAMSMAGPPPSASVAGGLTVEQRFEAANRLAPRHQELGLYDPPSVAHQQAFLNAQRPSTPVPFVGFQGQGFGSMEGAHPPPPFAVPSHSSHQFVAPAPPPVAILLPTVATPASSAPTTRGDPRTSAPTMAASASSASTSGGTSGGRAGGERGHERPPPRSYRPGPLRSLEVIVSEVRQHRRIVGESMNQFRRVLHYLQGDSNDSKHYHRDVAAFEKAGLLMLSYKLVGSGSDRAEVPTTQAHDSRRPEVAAPTAVVAAALNDGQRSATNVSFD